MTWVRIDDAFMDNQKVLACNPVAIALYMAGLCYCSRNLTDGHIPERAVDKLLNFGGVVVDYDGRLCDGASPVAIQITELVNAGLWMRDETGYSIHDYLEYQPSAAQVRRQRAELSEKRAAAGRLGGRPSSIKEATKKQNESKTKAPYPVPTPVPNTDTSDVTEHTHMSADADARALFVCYRERIQPQARDFPVSKIKSRLKRFTVDELRSGIDHFARDAWQMSHNASRGAAWFFQSDARSEQYLNLEPRPKEEPRYGGLGAATGRQNGGTQGDHSQHDDLAEFRAFERAGVSSV